MIDHDREFTELGRKAFEVMMHRGWGVRRIGPTVRVPGKPLEWMYDMPGQWQAVDCRPQSVHGINSTILRDDPFTALVDADKWYHENFEIEAREGT